MNEETYQVGELIEATVILGGRERRELLSYQPDPGPEEDLFPWQRIERGERDEFTSYFSAEELANVRRMVAVPFVTKVQVARALSDNQGLAQIEAVLALFRQTGSLR